MKARTVFKFIILSIIVSVAGLTLYAYTKYDEEKEVKKTELLIGSILPLSGKASQYGKWIQQALELAKDEINADGGINGKNLVIVYEDDQANPKLASSSMIKLVEVDKVPLVFGSWASSSVLAQAPIANKSNVVVMCQGISPKVRDAGDFIFRMLPDTSVYMQRLVPYVMKKVNPKSALIMYVNNDFGLGLGQSAEKLLVAQGVKNVELQAFSQGETNFRTQLTIAREKKFEATLLFSYAEAGHILKQAKELNYTSAFFASGTFENPNIITIAEDAANGTIYPYHVDLDSPLEAYQTFQKNYKERYGRSAEAFGILAYDGLKILAEGLRKCGPDGACVRDFLYKLEGYKGVTGDISFDDHGDIIKKLFMKTVENKKFVGMEEK